MSGQWKDLKEELEEETKKLFENCPDEIKRFHYGIISHSDAGKESLNQYFGHWVHTYGFYYIYSMTIPQSIRQLANNPVMDLIQIKAIFCDFFSIVPFMGEYAGQKTIVKFSEKMIAVMDSIETKDEFIELLDVFHTYFIRLYWWFHWYFPWGLGASSCQRLTREDIDEIVRLSKDL
jgi:hypothetical protein